MSDVPVYDETYTSAAIDGARISCLTACVLISHDAKLSDVPRALLLGHVEEALKWLDGARQVISVEMSDPTSVHVVNPDRPIIIPGGGMT